MGSSGSKDVTIGYKYYAGVHMALCHGPVDKLARVRVGGKVAWVGNEDGGQIQIDKPNLFGGKKREGGISGAVDIEMGGPTQGQNSYLASKLGSELLPAFRGICCAVLRQVYMGMNPYLKDWAWLLQRVHIRHDGQAQWYNATAAIGYFQVDDSVPPIVEESVVPFSEWDLIVPAGSTAGVWLAMGNGVTHDLSKQAAGSATATRVGTFSAAVFKIEFDFMLESVVSGRDSAVLNFLSESGSIVFSFRPWNGGYSDLPRFQGQNLDSVPLIPARSYHCSIVQIDSSTISCSLFYSGLVGSVTVSGSLSDIKKYQIENSWNYGGAALIVTRYSEIAVYQRYRDPGLDVAGYVSDMNPAHIVRECLTDASWGLGYADEDIDDTSFTTAADRLFSEGMGISILWAQQTSLEDFIADILRHIDGTLFVDRSTGKFKIKLVRADYDESSLLVLDKTSISKVENYTCQTQSDLVNEVTVLYNSHAADGQDSVTLQNIALIQQQGAIVPATVEYPGFANQNIAARACARDLKALSTPLVSCTLYAQRAAAVLTPGDVFVWEWEEKDESGNGVVTSYVMRVSDIAYGDGVENAVRIVCSQDVFDLPEIVYVEVPPTEWASPSADPLAATPRLVMELPYYEIVRKLGDTDANAKLTALPEIGFLMVAAGRAAVEINAELQVDSGAGYAEGGTLDFCPCAVLDGAIGRLDTTATLKDGVDLDEFADGNLAQIDDEIIVIESIIDGVATIRRGCLDTVPALHADGAAVIIWGGYAASDNIEYVSSDELDIKILTVTGAGLLAIAGAPVDSVVMNQRANRPYPPADVKIGGVYYPSLVVADDLVGIVATWVHRDRKQQTGGVVLGWTDGSVGPESGVTYSARLVRTDTEAELGSSTAISGTTVTFTPTYRGEVRLEVWSVRGGLESFQIFEHTFDYVSQLPVYHGSAQVYHGVNEVYYEI